MTSSMSWQRGLLTFTDRACRQGVTKRSSGVVAELVPRAADACTVDRVVGGRTQCVAAAPMQVSVEGDLAVPARHGGFGKHTGASIVVAGEVVGDLKARRSRGLSALEEALVCSAAGRVSAIFAARAATARRRRGGAIAFDARRRGRPRGTRPFADGDDWPRAPTDAGPERRRRDPLMPGYSRASTSSAAPSHDSGTSRTGSSTQPLSTRPSSPSYERSKTWVRWCKLSSTASETSSNGPAAPSRSRGRGRTAGPGTGSTSRPQPRIS